MIRVALVRGSYLNNFELQNYRFNPQDIQLTVIGARRSIHSAYEAPVTKLVSLADVGMPSQVANRLIGDRQLLFGLKKAVQGADIVHTADPHYFYSYQLARLRERGVIRRLVATSWEVIAHNNESVMMKRRIKAYTRRMVDRYICHTHMARECLIAEGVSPRRIQVIRLGVDTERFTPSEPHRPVNILFVGRLVPEKGVLDLYHATRDVLAQTHATLTIVGEGPLKKRLVSMVRHDRLQDKVTITSSDYAHIDGLYQAADVFVMPSRTTRTWAEQYGMVLVEAMASGLAIAAYRSGAIPELMDRCGILVQEGNVAILSSAIRRLVVEHDVRTQLGAAAYDRARAYFDAAATSLQLTHCYEDVITRR